MMLKPAYKLTFGSASDGGVLGAVSNLSPVPIGGSGKVIDTTAEPQASIITDLMVSVDMDTPADGFTFTMGQVGTFRPETGGIVIIELGYDGDDELTQVMTGTIRAIESGLTTIRVVGHAAAEQMLYGCIDETFENKTSGEIVTRLADEGGVPVAEAEDGITFPAYVVDGQRSLYRHALDLAGLCGFDLYLNSDGELVFKQYAGGANQHVLAYGQHIIELNVWWTSPRFGTVEMWGESPGGSQSEEDWAWLTKDFSALKGVAGENPPTRLIEKSVLRSRSAAHTASQALHTRMGREAIRGEVRLYGAPQIKLGDAIHIQDVPEAALNKVYQVRSVTHRISKLRGFTTTVGFRSQE